MNTEKIVGRCHKCDRPVHVGGEEGRVVCGGCDMATDNGPCARGA